MSFDRNQLKLHLERMPLQEVHVEVHGASPSLVATIVSPDFSAMDEAARQEMVWKHLYETFGDDIERQVEFVFTSSPDEVRAAAAGG